MMTNKKYAYNGELAKAIRQLNSGALVAIPTETVYGLAANAYNDAAVQSIFRTKNRPNNNPLILHLKNADEISSVAQNVPDLAWKLAHKFWPGPLTLILEKQSHISDFVSAGLPTIAVRVPNHKLTLKLLKKLDYPLVAPSANRSNHISPTSPEHVRASLGVKSPFILDGGACSEGLESTIIGFDGEDVVLYRHGALPIEQIETFIGKPLIDKAQTKEQSISPGTSKKHYSPNTAISICSLPKRDFEQHFTRVGYLVLNKTFDVEPPHMIYELSPTGSLAEAAAKLYAALHELDHMNLDLIVAQRFPDVGIGKAINDRLARAAAV
jgi:L-threonylcarbamoyladenylate synthase